LARLERQKRPRMSLEKRRINLTWEVDRRYRQFFSESFEQGIDRSCHFNRGGRNLQHVLAEFFRAGSVADGECGTGSERSEIIWAFGEPVIGEWCGKREMLCLKLRCIDNEPSQRACDHVRF
jgi:hypothetical protein